LFIVYWVAGRIIKLGRATKSVLLQPTAFFLTTVAGSIYLGTRTVGEQEWFPNVLSEVHAQFLAEWQFINFILLVLLPLSVVALVIGSIVSQQHKN
jgi:hypothetical protein